MKQTPVFLSIVLLLGAGLAAYGAHIWRVYQSDTPALTLDETGADASEPSVVALAQVAFSPEPVNVEHILENALFEPSRKPPRPELEPEAEPDPEPEPEPEPEVDTGPEPLEITILGIVMQDDTGIVMYRPKQGGQPKQASVGDTIDGWELVELTGVFAVFEQDDEEVRLTLRFD